MKINGFKHVLFILLTLCLFACGGSDSNKNDVIDDNIDDIHDNDSSVEQQSSSISMGVISGFGSVFLNGVEYDTITEVVVTFAGQSIPFEDLDVGDVIVLSKSTSGSESTELTEIEVVTLAIGPIQSFTTTSASETVYRVLEQNIIATPLTFIDADLVVNDVVAVSGLRNRDGDIVASKIYRLPDDTDTNRVRGVISDLDLANAKFNLGDFTVHLADDISTDDLADDVMVEVEINSGSTVVAITIVDTADLFQENTQLEFKAQIKAESDEELTLVTGLIPEIIAPLSDDITVTDGSQSDLVAGKWILVSGSFDENEQLILSGIKLLDGNLESIAGVITALDISKGTVAIAGVEYNINNFTLKQDASDSAKHFFGLEDLQVGDSIELISANNGSERILQKLTRVNDTAFDQSTTIKGLVESISETGLSLQGVMITFNDATKVTNTNSSDSEDNAQTSVQTFLASLSLGDYVEAVGQLVESQLLASSISGPTMLAYETEITVDGEGFLVLEKDDLTYYTKSGTFGLDNYGYLSTSRGERLKGWGLDSNDNVVVESDTLKDIWIDTVGVKAPEQTTSIEQVVNLDSGALILADYGTTTSTSGTNIGIVLTGDATLDANNYSQSELTVTYVDGTTRSITVPEVVTASSTSAANIATELNLVLGLTAVASTSAALSFPTEATLKRSGSSATQYFPTSSGQLLLNGNGLTSTNLADMTSEIDNLAGFSATLDSENSRIVITNESGDNIRFDVSATGNEVAISVQGVIFPSTLIGDSASTIIGTSNPYSTASTNEVAIIGGRVSITMDDIVATTNGLVESWGLAGTVFGNMSQAQFANNTLDVGDPNTYNYSTTSSIYDSLGIEHELTEYFVKEKPIIVGGRDNIWSMYARIDGHNIDVNLVGTEPSLTRHELAFNSDGSLSNTTESMGFHNWTPVNSQDQSTGALGASGLDGTEITTPPLFSDFVISVAGTTVYAGEYLSTVVRQNGRPMGRFSETTVSAQGLVYAAYNNGASVFKGQIPVAIFSAPNQLEQVDDDRWRATSSSGEVTTTVPGVDDAGSLTIQTE